ncbi:MAG TPA: hypothetical protein VGQ41_00955 [Pyrinomonadaceae bacterium]|jgi:hypothetical protein|nr:hypothetical protein [Pyrinomonadaceae bacterium]
MTVRVRLALLVATCAFVASACSISSLKSGSESKANNSNTKSSTAGSAFTPSSDARKDVLGALAKLNSAYPYRLTETMSALTNGASTMPGGTRVVEFEAADRSHMKFTGGVGGDVEAITIGEKHYWYSSGKWSEGSLGRAGDGGVDFAKKLAEMVRDVKYVGSETVNGIACHAYACTFDGSMAGQSWSGTSKVWIGANDGLPHQSDSDLKFSNYAGKSHVVYEYGGNIKVTPPTM